MSEKSRRNRCEKWFAALAVALLVYLCVLAGVAAYRAASQRSSDFLCFHRTAEHFLAHRESTQDEGVFGSPPFLTLLMVPFAIKPVWLASLLWSAANVVMLAYVVLIVDRVMVPPRVRNPLIRVAIPMACALAYVHACLVLGQLGILVLFLLAAMWALYEQNRHWWAGVILAVAVQVKVFPLAWLAYWIVKRRWRVVGGTLVGLAGTLVLTLQAFTPTEAWRAHTEWLRGAVAKSAEAFRAPTGGEGESRPPASEFFRYKNQALSFTLRRLLSEVDGGDGPDYPLLGPVNLSGSTIRAVHLLVSAALLIWLTTVFGRPASQCSQTRMRWEACIMMLAPLWFSPIVWVHYLPLAYPALAMLSTRLGHDNMVGRRNHLGVAGMAVWILAAVMLALPWMRALGVQLWATIFLAWILSEQAARDDARHERGS